MVRLFSTLRFILAFAPVFGASLDNTGALAKRISSSLGHKNNNPFLTIAGNTCHVHAQGAGQDDGPTILQAFSLCKRNSNILLDGYYVVNTVLNTTGLVNVQIELSGTIQYTPNIAYWSPNSIPLIFQNATTFWLLGGNNIHLYGGGTIDGNGQIWWDAFANNGNAGVAGGSSTTFARPIPLAIGRANGALVEHINVIQSPFWHHIIINSSNVVFRDMSLRSVSFSSSPAANTDGWDIFRSDHVTIQDSVIVNDDDCVSMKPNATNIFISNLNCNGSHGISVGSLGQFAGETDIVENVLAENIVMANAQNGARIKAFGGNPSPTSISGGGTGHVQNVTFKNFHVENVDNPIIINQCFETSASVCAQFPSNLKISDIHYENVFGTASAAEKGVVVSLECSQPCNDITARDINITPPAPLKAQFLCSNITSLNQLDFTCQIVKNP